MQKIKLYKVSMIDSKTATSYLCYYKKFIKIKSTIKDKLLLGLQEVINSPRF